MPRGTAEVGTSITDASTEARAARCRAPQCLLQLRQWLAFCGRHRIVTATAPPGVTLTP